MLLSPRVLSRPRAPHMMSFGLPTPLEYNQTWTKLGKGSFMLGIASSSLSLSFLLRHCYLDETFPEPVKNHCPGPAQCGSAGWASSHREKGCRFDSCPGYMPGFQVWSLGRAHTRGNRSMFLSHIDVSLSLFLPPFPGI